ncbi:cytochrome P450 [Collybia nuda]|uniref:Cytochrome P450 n=1 Tax=Collybia nuda TaxID=64659 RepID=A0A9P5YE37_9AGAR|nr:cytochrome P450 [Collybia nuda]
MVEEGAEHQWIRYAKWSETYGDLVYLKILGQPFLVLNSAKATTELLDRRSANYSDRTYQPMVYDLMSWRWNFALMSHNDWWRIHRKTFHQFFSPKAVLAYQPIQRKATDQLLKNLLKSPKELTTHLHNHAGSVILQITYGYEIQSQKDFYVNLAAEAFDGLTKAVNAGSFLVDLVPFLKYIPTWFPGAAFKRNAEIWSKAALALRDRPFDLLKASVDDGTAPPCFVTGSLAKIKDLNPTEKEKMETVIRNCAGVSYLGGSDTSVSLILNFILAMITHPHVLAKAQEEIDSVVGTSRLPDFSDRKNLPYLEAVLTEALRWLPIVPLAVPHRSTHEDVYEGYRIPAGTSLIGNAWAIGHDPVTHPDPHVFKPERFLKEPGKELPPDPTDYAFGYGRRICPGRYLGLNSSWIGIATMLSTFSITKALDKDGNPIEPTIGTTSGTVTYPLPFECDIKPRSQEAIDLIEAGYEKTSD